MKIYKLEQEIKEYKAYQIEYSNDIETVSMLQSLIELNEAVIKELKPKANTIKAVQNRINQYHSIIEEIEEIEENGYYRGWRNDIKKIEDKKELILIYVFDKYDQTPELQYYCTDNGGSFDLYEPNEK